MSHGPRYFIIDLTINLLLIVFFSHSVAAVGMVLNARVFALQCAKIAR